MSEICMAEELCSQNVHGGHDRVCHERMSSKILELKMELTKADTKSTIWEVLIGRTLFILKGVISCIKGNADPEIIQWGAEADKALDSMISACEGEIPDWPPKIWKVTVGESCVPHHDEEHFYIDREHAVTKFSELHEKHIDRKKNLPIEQDDNCMLVDDDDYCVCMDWLKPETTYKAGE